MTKHKGIRIGKNIVLWVVILAATAWVVFPFYWAIVTSLK